MLLKKIIIMNRQNREAIFIFFPGMDSITISSGNFVFKMRPHADIVYVFWMAHRDYGKSIGHFLYLLLLFVSKLNRQQWVMLSAAIKIYCKLQIAVGSVTGYIMVSEL
jgi:hypothetical protein